MSGAGQLQICSGPCRLVAVLKYLLGLIAFHTTSRLPIHNRFTTASDGRSYTLSTSPARKFATTDNDNNNDNDVYHVANPQPVKRKVTPRPNIVHALSRADLSLSASVRMKAATERHFFHHGEDLIVGFASVSSCFLLSVN